MNTLEHIVLKLFIYIINIFGYKPVKKIGFLKLDSIGDYILVRNHIEYIKQHSIYKDYDFVLIGNKAVRDFVIALDNTLFEKTIWVDKHRNEHSFFYRLLIQYKIQKEKINILLYPTYSRDYISEHIITYSNARQKICFDGDTFRITQESKTYHNTNYTQIINSSTHVMFEFERNKYFFETFLNTKINLTQPSIILTKNKPEREYILLSVSAGEPFREWSFVNFVALTRHLIQTYNYSVLISGFNNAPLPPELVNDRVIDKRNILNAPEIIEIINNARLIVCNDSAPLHIAAATAVPFICISNGNHFGRFLPYPSHYNVYGKYLFPLPAFYEKSNFDMLADKNKYLSEYDINGISLESVISTIESFLN